MDDRVIDLASKRDERIDCALLRAIAQRLGRHPNDRELVTLFETATEKAARLIRGHRSTPTTTGEENDRSV